MAASPSSSSDEQYPIGSVLDGRYRIEAVLGTGGMGRVYRAEHVKIGRTVAIKVLHADLNRNREASQRFQREAIASGRLDHPNIVAVSDFGVLDDGACYLVMEVLEGESLGDRLERDRRIHWVEAIEVLRGVLHGLRHAHERGVVHRDIKPDNVFLARRAGELSVKILDFGIAKLYAGSSDDPASTRAGLTVGTPAYLSPEQAVGGEITPRSDLYSASIVLYEMLAGRAPFEDKDPLAMLGAHVSRRPPLFAVTAPGVDIPARLEDVVQHGLMKAAADRIPSAAEYVAMLDALSPPARPRLPTYPGTDSGPYHAAEARSAAPAALDPTSPTRDEAIAPAASVPQARAAVSSTAVRGSGAFRAPPHATSNPAALPASAARSRGQATTPLATASLAATPPAAAVSLEMAQLPRAIRAVSLADAGEPIPLSWIVRSGVLIGLVIIAAVVLALATHCGRSAPSATSVPSPGAAVTGSSSTSLPVSAPAASGAGDVADPDPDAQDDAPAERRPARAKGRGRSNH
jgi:eukaryotic-like serine/threonine-protein kinase